MIFVHCDSAFVKTWKKWYCDIFYEKIIFLRNYLTKSNVVFCKRQVISYSFITWNYTFIYSILRNVLMRKVRLYFVLGHTVLHPSCYGGLTLSVAEQHLMVTSPPQPFIVGLKRSKSSASPVFSSHRKYFVLSFSLRFFNNAGAEPGF